MEREKIGPGTLHAAGMLFSFCRLSPFKLSVQTASAMNPCLCRLHARCRRLQYQYLLSGPGHKHSSSRYPFPCSPLLSPPELVIAQTRSGGHVAFSEGFFPGRASWMERVTLDWFDAVDKVSEA